MTLLSAVPGYNQARYGNVPAMSPQELDKAKEPYYEMLQDLVKWEADAKKANINGIVTAYSSVINAETRILMALGTAAGAQAQGNQAAAAMWAGVFSEMNKGKAHIANFQTDLSALERVNAACQDTARSFARNVIPDVSAALDAPGADKEAVYRRYVELADKNGGDSGGTTLQAEAGQIQDPNLRTSTLIDGLNTIGRNVRNGTDAAATGPHAAELKEFGQRYEREILTRDKTRTNFHLTPEIIKDRNDQAAEATNYLTSEGAVANSMRVAGMPEVYIRKVFGDADTAKQFFLHPEETWKQLQNADSPDYITEQKARVQARLDELDQDAKDPYERALNGYIRKFRVAGGGNPDDKDNPSDPWMTFMGAMRFQGGLHSTDRAALWAVKHQPQVASFLAQVKKDPSLSDLSDPTSVDRAREVLHGTGLHTRPIERATGIAIPPPKQAAGVVVAGGAPTGEQEPALPRIVPGTKLPTATPPSSAVPTPTPTPTPTATATAKATTEPIADAKPGTVAKSGGGGKPELYMEPSGWAYAYNPSDASVKIIRAPAGHEKAVSPTPLTEGKPYDAILDAIREGRAKRFGNPRSTQSVADAQPARKDKALGAPVRPNLPDAQRAHDEAVTFEPKDKAVEPAKVESAEPAPTSKAKPTAPTAKPTQKLTPAKTLVQQSLAHHTSAALEDEAKPAPDVGAFVGSLQASAAKKVSPRARELQGMLDSASSPAAKDLIQKALDKQYTADQAMQADAAAKYKASNQAALAKALAASGAR